MLWAMHDGSQRVVIRSRYRMLRASLGISQLETSARARVSYARYWKIENGYVLPTATEEVRLARVFKLSRRKFIEQTQVAA